MFRVVKNWVGDDLTFHFSGELDESVDLMGLLGNVPLRFSINSRGLTRINSQGLKTWISYFQSCVNSGICIRYIECSPAHTSHLGTILMAGAGGEIESVMAPFCCRKCNGTFEAVILVPNIGAIKPQITGRVCPKCGGAVELDEVPQEYFAFLGV